MDADDLLSGVRAAGDGDTGVDPLLARIGRAARAGAPADEGEPPPGLWAAIAAATGVDAGAPVEEPRPPLRALGHAAPRRRLGLVIGALAAAAAVIVAVGVVGLGGGRDDGELVAATALGPLAPGESAAGRAEVHRTRAQLQLDVTLSNLSAPASGTFYELWLIDSGVTKLISLGPVRPDGRYVVPAGVDLSEYPVVDVSVEPIDGNTSHSGASILRGTLDT